MKKILFLAILICSSVSFAQKNKKAVAPTPRMSVLAKEGNVTAAVLNQKGGLPFVMLVSDKVKSDTILIKTLISKEAMPTDCKLTPFTAKGEKLCLLSWTEKSETGDLKTKLEKTTETHSQIWDIAAKKPVHANVGKVVNITETVFLDPNKTASKTQDKIRREGFDFALLPDGTIVQKNKTQQDVLEFDTTNRKFVSAKPAAATAKKKK